MSIVDDSHLTDEVVNRAFDGTNFGRTDFRTILAETVMKRASGYHSGYTATTICMNLGLLSKKKLRFGIRRSLHAQTHSAPLASRLSKESGRMAKSSDVHDLLTAYQKQARKIPPKGVYASKQRQAEVQAAHARKVLRQCKRSVGKSNKLGCRRRAEVLAAMICEMNFWALVCRNNRKQERAA